MGPPAVAYVNWSGYLFSAGHSSFNGAATAITPTAAKHLKAAWAAPFRPAGGLYASPTVHDGSVYIGSLDGVFYRLNERTGAVVDSINLGTEHSPTCSASQTPSGIAATAEIKRMWVDPEHRGTGVGRALLERLIADAGTAGYQRIRLDSPDFMANAHRLYRSSGFVHIEA